MPQTIHVAPVTADPRLGTPARTAVDNGPPARLRRRRFGAFAVIALILSTWFAVHGGYSWHYFVQGSRLLFDGAGAAAPAGGLDIYANYPQLQIGPLSFAVAQVVRHLGGVDGLYAAEALMAGAGLAVLYVIERIVEAVRPELAESVRLHRPMLIGGGVFMIGWVDLSVSYAHLDDVLALALVVFGLWAAVANLPAVAGVCLGLSVDAKPWALVFLPLILVAPRHSRRYVAVWAGFCIAVAWLPFVLGDIHTISAASQFTITNEPDSALRALGILDPGTPRWDRLAQIALACLLGAIALLRQRWPALILLGVGARVALDPGVYGYYTAGVLLGALLWDLLGTRRATPTWTLISGATLAASPILISAPALRGEVRLWLVIAFTCALLVGPAVPRPLPQSGQRTIMEARS